MCVCVWGGAGGGSKGIQGRRKRLLVKQNSANNDSAGVNNTLQRTSTNHGLYRFNSMSSC